MTETTLDAPTEVVIEERRGGALWLWLHRPDRLNALSPAVLDALDQGLARAASTEEICCVVIAARGRAFCAGADLQHVKTLLDVDDRPSGTGLRDAQTEFLHRVARTFDAIEAFPKPVIAAVQGVAVAGGLELILCCDLVFAAESASFGDAHGNFGLVPGGGGSIRLPRRVGATRAKYLLYTGERLSAATFAETGLINEVTTDEGLVTRVEAVVDRLSGRSPVVLRLMKRLVNDGMDVSQEIALRMEIRECELYEQSSDIREGVDAFVHKRTPRFTGR